MTISSAKQTLAVAMQPVRGYPAWTRTRNEGTKNPCVTITPPGSGEKPTRSWHRLHAYLPWQDFLYLHPISPADFQQGELSVGNGETAGAPKVLDVVRIEPA